MPAFALPAAMVGLWLGSPDFGAMGPIHRHELSITRAPNADFLIQNNFTWARNDVMGWQRFYVEGSGATAGNFWYCGALFNFVDQVEEAGGYRPDLFRALPAPTTTTAAAADPSVTFCLASDEPAVDVHGPYSPFRDGCSGCDCANYTLTLRGPDALELELTFGGPTAGSKHLHSHFARVGEALPVPEGYMPAHGANFSCDFTPGGRDMRPIPNPSGCPLFLAAAASSSSATAAVDSAASSALPPAVRDLMLPPSRRGRRGLLRAGSGAAADVIGVVDDDDKDDDWDHCYIVNGPTGMTFSWTVDGDHLRVQLQAAAGPDDYLAMGFRPRGRAGATPATVALGTGTHNKFGMTGADIVAGSAHGHGVFYASEYIGAPAASADFAVAAPVYSYDATAGIATFEFSRHVSDTGHLHAAGRPSNETTVLSLAADVLWAVGPARAASGGDNSSAAAGLRTELDLSYHEGGRGLRFINWLNPDHLAPWKC